MVWVLGFFLFCFNWTISIARLFLETFFSELGFKNKSQLEAHSSSTMWRNICNKWYYCSEQGLNKSECCYFSSAESIHPIPLWIVVMVKKSWLDLFVLRVWCVYFVHLSVSLEIANSCALCLKPTVTNVSALKQMLWLWYKSCLMGFSNRNTGRVVPAARSASDKKLQ